MVFEYYPVAKILYGSNNYCLNTPTSDKDYYMIAIPSWNALFKNREISSKLDDNTAVWDIRKFCKLLMEAKPNTLELLFSVEQIIVDPNFKEVLNFARENVGSIIRTNWISFTKSVKGMAENAIKRDGMTSKTVSRAVYLHYLWENVAKSNGNMTEETWRGDFVKIPKEIRFHEKLTLYDKIEYQYGTKDWSETKYAVVPTEEDYKKCEEIQQKILDYLIRYLTKN